MAKPCPATGKRKHPTQRSAIRSALASTRTRAVRLRIYRCPHCHTWHLTSKVTPAPKEKP